MAGKELGFPARQRTASSLREQLARNTLRNVRSRGHKYVDLREEGKTYIFYCTLCRAPCYNDTVLNDHLRGNHHRRRYAAAEATLFGPNPWPFDDGILFFDQSDEQDGNKTPSVSSGIELVGSHGNNNSQAIIVHSANNENAKGRTDSIDHGEGESGSGSGYSDYYDNPYDMVIPGVMAKDVLCELGVKLMGYGQISARLLEKDKAEIGVKSMWCEWLGKVDDDDIKNISDANEFAIVTFRYYYDLGKQSLFEDIKSLLMSKEDNDNLSNPGKRQKKCLSDPGDVSESLSNQWDSGGEDSSSTANSRLPLGHYDDQALNTRILSSKSLRREVRKQQLLAAERMCDICQHKMLPGKDVAALLNMKTGILACSRRNVHGAFHVFHTSCLIHWILLCESEMFANKPVNPNSNQKPKRKNRSKSSDSGKQCSEGKVSPKKRSSIRKQSEGNDGVSHQQIRSVFCPGCQGSGVDNGEGELEKPTYHLSEIFRYKIKRSDAHRSWMKTPEKNLQNCSTGLKFTVQDEEAKENVSILKLLRFYRADEDSWIASS